MDDKRALLGGLKIEAEHRTAQASPSVKLFAVVTIAVIAGLAWWLWPGNKPISVHTSVATPAGEPVDSASSSVLEATGYVTARRKATVSSKITGRVAEVFIEEGMRVAGGQLLARLDAATQQVETQLATAQLDASRATLREVEVQLHEAELTLNRTSELAAAKLASTADLDRARLGVDSLTARLASYRKQVEVSEQSLKLQHQLLTELEIRAPFDGIVVAKAAQPGEMISPVSAGGGFTRTGICTIVDMDSLEIEVDVNEAYINRVQPGQRVTAQLNSYPDWRIPAEVITIIPTAERSKATVRVRIRFLERDARILPDMGVKVSFMEEKPPVSARPGPRGVLIPESAIRLVDGSAMVLTVEDDRAKARPVTLGDKLGSNRNVTEGLAAGEVVIDGLTAALYESLEDGATVVLEKP